MEVSMWPLGGSGRDNGACWARRAGRRGSTYGRPPYRKQGAMSAGEQLGAGNLTEDVDATPAGLVEQHHIGVIPESDRHGRPRDQFTLWFAANANVVNFTLGVLAIVFGLNLFWALVAIVVGNVLGMLLTALHAWQGPRLGVPQMIQSRGQFGFYGASFIILVSIVLD